MTILSKCPKCETYNISEKCRSCGEQTKDAHYKYNGLRDVVKAFKTKRFRHNNRIVRN